MVERPSSKYPRWVEGMFDRAQKSIESFYEKTNRLLDIWCSVRCIEKSKGRGYRSWVVGEESPESLLRVGNSGVGSCMRPRGGKSKKFE
ncbi:hypothetical protein DRO66_05760 [Candidatus Bathyarchaeota archaeon]|nr:MAG: hypothetical protein DRO66_05760 [Candidatus Bathyarchaeota archaeon]